MAEVAASVSRQLEIDLSRGELLVGGKSVPIGGRAFDIVQVLVEAAGDLVTKSDLMDRIWPNIFVGDNTLQVHVSAIRRALGEERGLLKTISGRGYRLLGNWAVRKHSVEPGRMTAGPAELSPRALPIAVSGLIGRASAVQRLGELLLAYRVVTLTGPGGIGKTQLALEVAHRFCLESACTGAAVELVSLSDPGLVLSTVANALGLSAAEDAATPAALARAIGDVRLLLFLDNCEHLIEAAARLVDAIVHLCPRTTILTTSRESLRVDGECSFQVAPLDVPPEDLLTPEAVLCHSAVQLFIARVDALSGGAMPRGTADLDGIATICRRLDGIPLAIELAAARAATLGLPEILRRLGDRFALLTAGRRTALPRHRTLRGAIDWSYNLLAAHEQKILRAAAIFAAGFTLEGGAAAAAVDSQDVLDTITSLVDKSLVQLDPTAEPVRWRLLETTRAYALQALREAGEHDDTARQQAGYYVEYLSAAGDEFLRPTPEHVSAYLPDIDNVRGALDWAFSSPRDVLLGVRLTGAAIPLWLGMSLLTECRERIERALDSLPHDSRLDPRVRLRLYAALGISLFGTLAMQQQTGSALNEMLAIAEDLDDVDYQLQALWTLWSYYINNGKNREAEIIARKLMDVARRGGVGPDFFVGERLLGATLHYRGQQSEAQHYLEDVLTNYVSSPEHLRRFLFDQAVLARSMIARVQWMRGLTDQAMRNARDATAAAKASGHVLSLCYALAEAGCPVPLAMGELSSAEDAISTLVEVATKHRLNLWRLWAHCLRGTLLIRRGMTAEGVAVLRDELNAFRMAGWSMRFPAFLGEFAAGLARVGQVSEALASIEEALARAERDGEMWCTAELTRIKGEIVLRAGGDAAVGAARTCFIAAIAVAQQQGALFWELRAVLSSGGPAGQRH